MDSAGNIADAIKHNQVLTTLSLRKPAQELGCNEIKSDGAENLAKALQGNNTLTSLNLSTACGNP